MNDSTTTTHCISRERLTEYLDTLLHAADFKDYCPNGLQVEGREQIHRVVGGVTACQRLIEAAAVKRADVILVHHGWFWRNEDGRITSFRKKRLQTLLAHDISLFAYHLPLDAHPTLGNNAQLALRLGWTADGRFGDQDIGWIGYPAAPTTVTLLSDSLEGLLQRRPLMIGHPDQRIKRIAWCSGGGQSYHEEAIAAGADVFVSGEISEPSVHLARETGTAYIAAGHHATERYGVLALLNDLQRQFDVECEFIDIDNPV